MFITNTQLNSNIVKTFSMKEGLQDANNAEHGCYIISANNGEVFNVPFPHGILECFIANNNFKSQIFHAYDGKGIWHRSYWTAWSEWALITLNSDLNNYLPLSGGTMTGAIQFPGGAQIYPDGNIYSGNWGGWLSNALNSKLATDGRVSHILLGSNGIAYITIDGVNYAIPNGISAGEILRTSGGTITGAIYSDKNMQFAVNNDCFAQFLSNGGLHVMNRAGNGYASVYAASCTNPSSKLVKENICDITDDEARKILDINIVSFDYKEKFGGQKNNFGVIAEDVQNTIPYAVTIPKDYNEEDFYEDSDEMQIVPSVDYSKFVPYLIKMTQIQQSKIDELEEQLSKLVNN